MIWDIIANKIEAAGLGSLEEDIFIQDLPADVRSGIGMFAPLTGIEISPYMPGFYKPDIRIIVRDFDVAAGIAKADRIMKILTVEGEEVYPATVERGRVVLKVFYPKQLPIQFPRQDGNGIEWALSFQTAFAVTEEP